MHNHRRLAACLWLTCTLATQIAAATEHREHGAHVHGVGQLNIALDGTQLEIELDSPAANLVGFEHAPRNAAEQVQLDQALAKLRDGQDLFILPVAAACRLQEIKVAEEGAEHQENGDEASNHHADISGLYRFHCDTPSALTGIDVRLFQRFPAIEKLEVQLIGPHGQRGTELTPQASHLSF